MSTKQYEFVLNTEAMTQPTQPQLRLSEIDFLHKITDEKGNLKASKAISEAEEEDVARIQSQDSRLADLIDHAYLAYFCIARGMHPEKLLTATQRETLAIHTERTFYQNNFAASIEDGLISWLQNYAALQHSDQELVNHAVIKRVLQALNEHARLWFPARPMQDNPFYDTVEGLQTQNRYPTPLDTESYGMILPGYIHTNISIMFAGRETLVGMPIPLPLTIYDFEKARRGLPAAYLMETAGKPMPKNFAYQLNFLLKSSIGKFLISEMAYDQKKAHKILELHEFTRHNLTADLAQFKNMYLDPAYSIQLAHLQPLINNHTGFFMHSHVKHEQVRPYVDDIFDRFLLLLKNAVLYKEILSLHRKKTEAARKEKGVSNKKFQPALITL